MKRLIFVLIILYTSCTKSGVITTGIITNPGGETTPTKKEMTTFPANNFNQLFTRYNAGSWTGGDVATSIPLPDGRYFWLFGDSFVDTVYNDRHRPSDAFIHNSIVTTDNYNNFNTYYGGNAANPRPYFDTAYPYVIWPSSAFINATQDKIYVMMVDIKILSGGGSFGFSIVGNTVGVLNYPALTLHNRFVFSNSESIDWSSATMTDNGYTYIYGAESDASSKFMHACRTSNTNPFQSVEYFDGNNWVSQSNKSARLLDSISEQISFFKYQNKYYVLSQGGTFLSTDIYLWDADSPVGPFKNKRKVYSTPQTKGNIWTYNATAHPEFSTPANGGNLLVGYCVNSFNGTDIYTNADNYRPYFFWVSNWQ